MKNRILPSLVGVLVAGLPLYGGCAGFNVLDSTSTTLVETVDAQGRIIYSKDGKVANGAAGQTQQYDANQKTTIIEQQLQRYKDDVQLDTTVDANGNVVESIKKKVTQNTVEVNKLANQSELDNLSRGVASIAATDKAVKDSLSTKANWVDYATQEQNVYGQKNAAGQRINSGINGKIVANAQAIDSMAKASTGRVSKLEGKNYGTTALSSTVTIGAACGEARANGDLARTTANGDLARTTSGMVAVCHGNVWKHGVTTRNELALAKLSSLGGINGLSAYWYSRAGNANEYRSRIYYLGHLRVRSAYQCGEFYRKPPFTREVALTNIPSCGYKYHEIGRKTRQVYVSKRAKQWYFDPHPVMDVGWGCADAHLNSEARNKVWWYYEWKSLPRNEIQVVCAPDAP